MNQNQKRPKVRAWWEARKRSYFGEVDIGIPVAQLTSV